MSLLLLPIDGRSAQNSAGARRGSTLTSESELSSPSDVESSNSDGLKLAVKNTFIDVEAFECDEQRELPLHQRGARTCTARLSQIGHFADAEDGELSTEASDTEFNEMENTGRHSFMVEATPEPESMRQILASAAFSMPPIEAQGPEPQAVPCPAPAQACEASEAPSQARQVMLQVPLEVAAASQAGSGDLQVAVLNSTSESLGSSTVIDMRIVVGPSGELQVFQSPAGQMLLSAALGGRAGGKTSSSDTQSSKSASSAPPSPAPESAAPADGTPSEVPAPLAQRRETRAKTAPAGAKSSMVCCHWKNKGWCRYQESCRFMHPEHKRGAGLNAGKGAVVAGTPSGSSPGGLSVGGGFHPQQTGSSSGRHVSPCAGADGFLVNMWTMPGGCMWAGFPSIVQKH